MNIKDEILSNRKVNRISDSGSPYTIETDILVMRGQTVPSLSNVKNVWERNTLSQPLLNLDLKSKLGQGGFSRVYEVETDLIKNYGANLFTGGANHKESLKSDTTKLTYALKVIRCCSAEVFRLASREIEIMKQFVDRDSGERVVQLYRYEVVTASSKKSDCNAPTTSSRDLKSSRDQISRIPYSYPGPCVFLLLLEYADGGSLT